MSRTPVVIEEPLRLSGVHKRHRGGVQALAGIELAVSRGMFGLLGPNGAGKSTLMQIITTLQEPDLGSVQLGSVDVLRDKRRARQLLGYLPQDFGVYPSVSVVRMLDYLAQLQGLTDRALRRRHVDALLERVHLSAERQRPLESLSGGMRQRFGVAQALIGDPTLVVLDEPTAGLDPLERHRLYRVLSQLGSERIVLLSTHLTEDVASLCQRMAILVGGRIVQQGTPRELVRSLDGTIWEQAVSPGASFDVAPALGVLSTRVHEARLLVTVRSPEPPPGFVARPPTLEDVYFSSLPSPSGG